MRTILERNETTLIRDRSSFIGILIHVTNKDFVKEILNEIRKEYPKAKHYCYAYIIGQDKKCSDDGEPAKTAGRPLLELLEKKEMDECLLVVVRYFGGVLLGASRLMSTYLESGVQTLDSADIVSIKQKYVYHMELSYRDFEALKRIANHLSYGLENINYGTKISVDVLLDSSDTEELVNKFPNASIEVYGQKKVYKRDYQ